MSSGPIPQIPFSSGIYTQRDAQNPIYAQPSSQNQEQQLIDNKVNQALSSLPIEAQQLLKSVNPASFTEAQQIINQFADEVLNESQFQLPTQLPQQQVSFTEYVQNNPVNNPIQYTNNYNTII